MSHSLVKYDLILQDIIIFNKKRKMSVPTGRPVAIQAKSNHRYLDGRNQSNQDVLLTNRNPYGDRYLNWIIRHLHSDIYVVQSLSSNGFLDGRNQNNQNVLVTNRYPDNDPYLQWRIFYTGEEDWFVFQSVSSRCFLDGRNHQENALVTSRNWRGDPVFYFKFHNV